MPTLQQIFHDLLLTVRDGTVSFLGILCFAVFVANAVLLGWLVARKAGVGLARCPKCGRQILCPHCEDDRPSPPT
jgi:hypothetical protein